MNRKILEVTSLRDDNVRSYWMKKTYLERIAALEQLRRIIFDYDPSTTRFQRTITITQLKKD